MKLVCAYALPTVHGLATATTSSRDRRLPQLSSLLGATEEGDAHLLMGRASGLVSGALLTLRPQEQSEETVVIHETRPGGTASSCF